MGNLRGFRVEGQPAVQKVESQRAQVPALTFSRNLPVVLGGVTGRVPREAHSGLCGQDIYCGALSGSMQVGARAMEETRTGRGGSRCVMQPPSRDSSEVS